ncbi:MAG: hypothetical protein WCF18_14460, partial [Chthoniobacteraceae bacterium]
DNTVQAYIKDSNGTNGVTTTDGALSVNATDDSSIRADTGGFALALGLSLGSGAGGGLGIGASISKNDIGAGAGHKVDAYIDNSTVTAAGPLTVNAQSTAVIDALALAGAAAVGVSASGTAGGIAGAGVGTLNSISMEIHSSIKGSSTVSADNGTSPGTAGNVTVSANDLSRIDSEAIAGAVSVAASGNATAGALAIGFSGAFNKIDNDVLAEINTGSVSAPAGNVAVTTAADATIKTLAVAASASVGASSQTGVALSGGGAVAMNTILSKANAVVVNASVDANGTVTIHTDSDATINAKVAAVALGIGAGGTTGGAAALGVSVARNFIGWDPSGTAVTADYTSDNTTLTTLATGKRVKVADGPLGGDVYEYLGATLTDGDPNTTGNQAIDLSVMNYGDSSLWKHVNVSADASEVRAYSSESAITAGGALTVEAKANENIDAIVVAASAALGGGGTTGVGVSGAGVYTENKIKSNVEAFIDGDGAVAASDGVTAGSVTISASDSSSIDAIAGAAALAGSAGGTTGAAVSIGLSIAFNEISGDTAGYIKNADQGVVSTTGNISVSAISQGKHLFDFATSATLTAANFDDAAKADQNDPDTTAVNEAAVDAAGDKTILTAIRAAFTAGGTTLPTLDTIGTESMLTSDSGKATPTAVVTNEIRTASGHGYATGDKVLYTNTGTNIGGLTSGTYYYVIKVSDTAFKLATSASNATAGTAITLTAPGSFAGQTVRKVWNPREGTTVKSSGVVYRFIGTDRDGVNLGTETYTNTTDWAVVEKLKISTLVAGQSWTLVAPDGESYVIAVKAGGGFSVSQNNINAISAAASLAAGFGGTTGVAISGAGAVAQNVILTKTNAYGNNSIIQSFADVDLGATSESTISSTVVAASLAIGGGGTTGVGASIGIAVARNFIGWTPGATTETPAEVRAYLLNSSVTAGDDLTQTATAKQTISSLVVAGSAAVAAGGTAGVAVSGSGVYAENKIGVDVKAFIDGDRSTGTTGISADSVTLIANDTSSIDAFAGAASLAASLGGTAGVSVSIGISLARNTITSDVEAYIVNADGSSASTTDNGVTTTGALSVTATENATINAIAAAASIAAGFGGTAGVAVSGAGADAKNVILTGTNAYIQASAVSTGTTLGISATNSAIIDATIIAASFAASIGGTAGVGASIGVALAHNFIGYDPTGTSVTATYDTTHAPIATLTNGDKIKVVGGPFDGYVYQYLGTTSSDSDSTTAGNQTFDLSKLDFSDTSKWQNVSASNAPATVLAYIKNAVIAATGKLTVTANDTASIDSTVFAGSAALAGGGVAGVGAAGAGASAENRVTTFVKAFVDGDSTPTVTTTGVRAAQAEIRATDSSSINAFTGAAAIAASLGGVAGVSLSIGVGLAKNVISNDVAAFIQNATHDGLITTDLAAGDLVLVADSRATITCTAGAASLAAAVGGIAGVSVSGAGADAKNVILTKTNAFISGSTISTAKDVKLDAMQSSTITATVLTASLAAAGGGIAGVGASVGASLARNFIGYSEDGSTKTPAQVQAYTLNSAIDARGAMSESAKSTSAINALVVSGSVAVAGGFVGVGAAGAGSSTENKIATSIKACIDGVGTTGIQTTDLKLTAADESTIDAKAGAAAIGAAFGAVGGSVSIGVGLARNTVSNDVLAYIANAPGAGNVAGVSTEPKFSTVQSSAAVRTGDRVRLAPGFGAPTFDTSLGSDGTKQVGIVTGNTVLLDAAYGIANFNATKLAIPVNTKTVPVNGYVQVNGGAIYKYLGASALSTDINRVDYSVTTSWVAAAPGSGATVLQAITLVNNKPLAPGNYVQVDGGSVYRFIADTAAANVDLNAETYTDTTRWAKVGGQAGATYQYLGTNQSLDLSRQDYTSSNWKNVGAYDTRLVGSTKPISLTDGNTVTLDPAYGVADFQATIVPVNTKTVATNGLVQVNGAAAYKFLGASASFDINHEDYTVTTRWTPVTLATGDTPIQASIQTVNTQTVNAGGYVQLNGGSVYRFIGATTPTTSMDINAQTYTDTTRWAKVGGIAGATYVYIGSNQTLDVSRQDYTSANWKKIGGVVGAIYQFNGTGATLNLGREDFTDTARWTLVNGSNLSTVQTAAPVVVGDRVLIAEGYASPTYNTKLNGATNAVALVAGNTVTLDPAYAVANFQATIAPVNTQTVDPNGLVRVNGGATYKFLGTASASFDINREDYSVTSRWTSVTPLATDTPLQATTTLENKQTVTFGNFVRLNGGTTYRFIGGTSPTETFDLNAETYTNTARWVPVAGKAGATYVYVGSNQSLDISRQDFTSSNWKKVGGTAGEIYVFKGTPGTLNLGREDYTDTNRWTLTDGSHIAVTATEKATIKGTATAASLAVAGGLVGVAVSGAGANAENIINGNTQAYVSNSTLSSGRDVKITATDNSTIDARIVSVALAAAGGVFAGSAAIGSSTAQNLIGYSTDGNTVQASQVRAYITGSQVDARRKIGLLADETATITANVAAGSVALAGGGVAVSASGAGVGVKNKIAIAVDTHIANSTGTGITAGAGDVSLNSRDISTITATGVAAALSGSVGVVGTGAAAIGAATSVNTIGN